MALRLRPLRPEDEAEARMAHEEMREDDFTFLLGWDPSAPWEAYLRLLANRRQGRELDGRWVPASFLVAVVDGEIVGRLSLRHELNEFLIREGGHIGYGVRPGHRRRGYATEILKQGLVIARAEGIDDVLVTCDEGNVPSIAVIERAGGVLEDVRVGEDGIPKRRYWIR